jgi:hypothetical protein
MAEFGHRWKRSMTLRQLMLLAMKRPVSHQAQQGITTEPFQVLER